jgi:hypothetical protein
VEGRVGQIEDNVPAFALRDNEKETAKPLSPSEPTFLVRRL